MSKIVLDVNPKDMDTVLLILKNLKSGLIKNISTDSKAKPISSSLNNKQIKQKVQEDEFLSSKPSVSKYMSRSEYKNRLSSNKK